MVINAYTCRRTVPAISSPKGACIKGSAAGRTQTGRSIAAAHLPTQLSEEFRDKEAGKAVPDAVRSIDLTILGIQGYSCRMYDPAGRPFDYGLRRNVSLIGYVPYADEPLGACRRPWRWQIYVPAQSLSGHVKLIGRKIFVVDHGGEDL